MKKPRGMRLALGFAAFLAAASLISDFLSSNPPSKQNLEYFFHPPSRIHFLDPNGGFRLRPFLYQTELAQPLEVQYREIGGRAYPLEFFFKGYPYKLFGIFPAERHLVGRGQPPFYYPMGTDELGRDVLARVLAGARTSLLVVLLGLTLYAILGTIIGVSAGLMEGWADSLFMRFSELVLALPALYLVLAIRALLPMRIPFLQTLFLTVAIIAAVAWPPLARGIRGLILQQKNSTYVEAARSLGGTSLHILRRHIWPSLLPFTMTQTSLAAPIFLLGEVVLSFLNVGFQDTEASWGAMLRNLKDTRVITDFWWNLLPLGMVFFTLLCLNTFSSRLRRGGTESEVTRI
jgi:peptide/nickel transport system permease protein